MLLTVLGSGCGVPSVDSASPGYLVQIGHTDHRLLLAVDMGPGALRQAAALSGHSDGLDFVLELDAILLTHLHVDHACDLPAFLFAARNRQNPRTKPLIIAGPEGLEHFIADQRNTWNGQLDSDAYEVTVIEMPLNRKGELSLKSHDSDTSALLLSQPVTHSRPAIGFRLEAPAHNTPADHNVPNIVSLALCGDSSACQTLTDLGRHADCMVCDCSFPFECEGHMTPDEIGKIAAEARPKTLLLSHFYPQMNRHIAVKRCQAAVEYWSEQHQSGRQHRDEQRQNRQPRDEQRQNRQPRAAQRPIRRHQEGLRPERIIAATDGMSLSLPLNPDISTLAQSIRPEDLPAPHRPAPHREGDGRCPC